MEGGCCSILYVGVGCFCGLFDFDVLRGFVEGSDFGERGFEGGGGGGGSDD